MKLKIADILVVITFWFCLLGAVVCFVNGVVAFLNGGCQ